MPAQHHNHNPLVHAVPTWPKDFQPADGRQGVLRVGERHQFSMDQISITGWAKSPILRFCLAKFVAVSIDMALIIPVRHTPAQKILA